MISTYLNLPISQIHVTVSMATSSIPFIFVSVLVSAHSLLVTCLSATWFWNSFDYFQFLSPRYLSVCPLMFFFDSGFCPNKALLVRSPTYACYRYIFKHIMHQFSKQIVVLRGNLTKTSLPARRLWSHQHFFSDLWQAQ